MKTKIIICLLTAAVVAISVGRNTAASDPQDTFTITLTVSVETLLENMNLLNSSLHGLVPYDGIIFHSQIQANAGDNAFDVLQREMRGAGIHMSARFTPVFNSAYVEAVNNIYEFDAGPLSGWMYSVNGEFPRFGSSLYELSPYDEVLWIFTLDLGRDVNAYWNE